MEFSDSNKLVPFTKTMNINVFLVRNMSTLPIYSVSSRNLLLRGLTLHITLKQCSTRSTLKRNTSCLIPKSFFYKSCLQASPFHRFGITSASQNSLYLKQTPLPSLMMALVSIFPLHYHRTTQPPTIIALENSSGSIHTQSKGKLLLPSTLLCTFGSLNKAQNV